LTVSYRAHPGKEAAVAFGLGAVSYWLLGTAGTTPWAFVAVRRPDLPHLA
jgi:hypothetical protein